MENQTKSNNNTDAFDVSMFLLFILFIVFLNKLPFFENNSFWQLTGILASCCVIGGLIFLMAMTLINKIYKVIIEVAVALLLFINVSLIAISWGVFEEVVFYVKGLGLGLEEDGNKFVTVIVLALSLFIIDLFAAFILVPMSRIAGSKVINNFE